MLEKKMRKLVVLKLGEGSFDRGFPVTLQIGEDGEQATIETVGKLPPAPELPANYHHWQVSYRRLGLRSRLQAKTGFVANVSKIEDCDRMAKILRDRFNEWLHDHGFRNIREKLLEQLTPSEEVRLILQADDPQIQRLPWHLWDWFERYPHAEIALSSPAYERIEPLQNLRSNLRILAILGHSEGIDIEADRAVLHGLSDADVTFLVEPDRDQLTEALWDDRGWDILFFAGHSSSQTDGKTGQIAVNPREHLTVAQLKNALKKAIARGLKIAIFNSCDGLGLARELADLHLPQMLVMREPVPDRVAQAFLKSFLTAFAQGNTFYLAVREAREKLQALEDRFPCATWLPTICQNPAVKPPTWQELSGKIGINEIHNTDQPSPSKVDRRFGWRPHAIASTLVTAVVLGIRFLGILQSWELSAFDLSLRLRPPEPPDPRLLIVTITEADVQAQDPTQRRGSLSDATLEKLLEKLETWQPRAIGLDIYRDYAAQPDLPNLAKYLRQTDRLIATCKISDRDSDNPGIPPPPEVPIERLGFSDFMTDTDGRVRRQLLSLTPEPTSPCLTPYAFNVQLAFRYLVAEDIVPQWTPDGNLQFGKIVFRRLTPRIGGYQGIDAGGNQVLLKYRASKRVATQVTLEDVLGGQVNPASVRDRLVFIGTTAESFGDYWHTPYSRNYALDEQMSGVTIQAQMVSQILSAVLDDRPLLWAMPQWGEILWIWGWSVVGSTMVWWFRSTVTLGGALGIASIALGGSCWLGLTYFSLWLPGIPSAISLMGTAATLKIYSNCQVG
jgi:CHASE2 domain-containing sensor protein